jgi:Flp pilus assembly pilin Flp
MRRRSSRNRADISSVKYGLIAVCISLAIATVLHGVGGKVKETLISGEQILN